MLPGFYVPQGRVDYGRGLGEKSVDTILTDLLAQELWSQGPPVLCVGRRHTKEQAQQQTVPERSMGRAGMQSEASLNAQLALAVKTPHFGGQQQQQGSELRL